jgi:hypothetical protein
MHGKGYIHRDLKPEKILLTISRTGGRVVAKISDFGSCVHIDHEYHLSLKVYTYKCIFIYIYIHIYIYVYIYVYIYICLLKVQQTGRSRASHEYSNRGTRNKDLQHLFLNTMKNSNIHERKNASMMGRGVLTGTCLYFCLCICVNVCMYKHTLMHINHIHACMNMPIEMLYNILHVENLYKFKSVIFNICIHLIRGYWHTRILSTRSMDIRKILTSG